MKFNWDLVIILRNWRGMNFKFNQFKIENQARKTPLKKEKKKISKRI